MAITAFGLSELISAVNKEISKYAEDFAIAKNDFDAKFDNQMSLLNERSISSISNLFIKNWLESKNYKVLLGVNEFPIKNCLEPSSLASLKIEVEVTNKDKWNHYYVDGFFIVENLYFPEKNYLFLEYKMNNRFVYADLATDYLKYKMYTKKDNKNTIFAYIICEKNGEYPKCCVFDLIRLRSVYPRGMDP